MIRETQEEIGVTPLQYEKFGIVEFDEYDKGEKRNLLFHLYIVSEWEGEPTETEEMNPKWFDIDKLPYNQMFPDDQYWLPLVLEGKKIKAYFQFDPNWNLVIKNIIEMHDGII